MGVAPWTGLISKERVHGHDSFNALIALGPDRWKLMIAQIFPNEKKTEEIKQIRAFSECIIQQHFGREEIGARPLVTLKAEEATLPKE